MPTEPFYSSDIPYEYTHSFAKETLERAVGLELLVGRSASPECLSIRCIMPDASRTAIVIAGINLSVHAGVPPQGRLEVWLIDGSAVVWSEPFVDGAHPNLVWRSNAPLTQGDLAV